MWKIAGRKLDRASISCEPLPILRLVTSTGWRFVVSADDDGLEDWSLIETGTNGFMVYCNGDQLTLFV